MTTFGELVDRGVLAVGDGYRAKNEELGDTGPIFLRSGYLQENGWQLSEPDRLERPLNGFGPKVAMLHDTVLTTKGNSLGRLGLVDSAVAGAIYSPHLSYWRSLRHNELLPRYLYYWAHSIAAQSQIKARSESTDMAPYLSLADQLALKIDVPGIEKQETVAKFLGAIDDKIELNRHASETLETIAHTLFKSWFVDFDPVHAKATGQSTGLPGDLAALFPDSFAPDGLPSGWEAKPLSETARFLNGLALQKYPAKENQPSFPVIKIAELRTGPTAKSARADIEIPAEYHVKDGDHLFSWSGSLTHCRWTHGSGALNQHLFKVTPNEPYRDWLVYEGVEQHLENFQAIASGKAVTMGHIQRHHLDEARIAIPSSNLLLAANAIFVPLYDRWLATDLQSRTLVDLRDALLPRLISGELQVADAKAQVSAA